MTNDCDWLCHFGLSLVAAAPGIAIYLHGVQRWKSWLWFRKPKQS